MKKSIIRMQRAGGKLLAGAWLMLLAAGWLTPCSGMEALTQEELGDLSGKNGISMGFIGDRTVTQSFQCIAQGDSDGWGTLQDGTTTPNTDTAHQGWLVLIGNGANTGNLNFTVPDNTIMHIDAGTTSGVCTPKSGCPGFVIPANRTYFTFTMSDADIGLIDPTTVWVALTNDPYDDDNAGTAIQTEMEMVGWMRSENLKIEKAHMTSKCFIWAHP